MLALIQYFGKAHDLWFVHPAALGEASANLRQTNHFASLTSLGLLGVLFWVAKTFQDSKPFLRNPEHKEKLEVILLLLCVMLLALGNALSGSRTGMLQWVLLCVATFVHRDTRGSLLHWVIFGLFAYFLYVILIPILAHWAEIPRLGLVGRIDDPNAFSRITLWGNVIELVVREPLLGHGWRSLAYTHYSSEFSENRFMEMLDNAHNLPLHLAVELGLPVALAFCGLVAWLVWKGKPWAETQPDRQLAWGVLLVIGIHSLLEYPLWYGPFFMTALICIGVLCRDLWRNFLLAGTESLQNAIILGVRGLAALLLVSTAFVAFDYHRVSQIYLQPEERSAWYAADPLGAAKQSVLFQSHAKFAELQITPLTKESAPRVLELSSELVRWSPEPRIIERLIESSVMLGLDDVAAFHLKRYKIAYPAAHALWAQRAL